MFAEYIKDRFLHNHFQQRIIPPIWSDKYGIYCEENAEKILMPIMDELLTALKEISRQAMKLDFYKAEKSEADLFYLSIVQKEI